MTKCTRPKEIFYGGNKGPLRETFNYSSAGYVIADKQSKFLFKPKNADKLQNFQYYFSTIPFTYVMTYCHIATYNCMVCDTEFSHVMAALKPTKHIRLVPIQKNSLVTIVSFP